MDTTRRRLLAGFAGVVTLGAGGCLGEGAALDRRWLSETATEYESNHHDLAVRAVGGSPVIGVPRNDTDGRNDCGIVALDRTGEPIWTEATAPSECTPHAIGDVGVGNVDGRPSFLVATESGTVHGYDVTTGDETFRADVLETIGYTRPQTGQFTATGDRELLLADFGRRLAVVDSRGSVRWDRPLDGSMYVAPLVVDATGDGIDDVVIDHGREPRVTACLDGSGEVVWRRERSRPIASWTSVETDRGADVLASTPDAVVRIDGRTGATLWRTDIADRPRIGAVDGGTAFVAARDGAVRCLDVADGSIHWRERATDEDVRMPAPAVGSVRDGPERDVVAVTQDGELTVHDGGSGEVLTRETQDANCYTRPVTVDLDGNGRETILVLRGDARVAAFDVVAGP